jgi:AraC family transcriptional regulator
MDYLRQVQRGIDYIEEHLDQEVSSADVARCAGISHWHFQRIFKALTNETLKTYIRSRRLANALDRLARSDARVIDVALEAGFDTQASFTRAFKKEFGTTPGHYRRTKERLPVLRKMRFDSAYLSHIHGHVSLEPELCEQPALHLVGMSTRFFGVDSEKNNVSEKLPGLWGAFLARLEELPQRFGPGYGVVQQTPDKTDELEYLAAFELPSGAAVPPGMTSRVVPAGRYAKFAHRGRAQELDQTVNYIYASWLARSGLRHSYAADIEIYGAEYHPESEQSLVHYAIPVLAAAPLVTGLCRGAVAATCLCGAP